MDSQKSENASMVISDPFRPFRQFQSLSANRTAGNVGLLANTMLLIVITGE